MKEGETNMVRLLLLISLSIMVLLSVFIFHNLYVTVGAIALSSIIYGAYVRRKRYVASRTIFIKDSRK